MKFLLFNVAVAAALVFLFTADRGEVQKIAGQVHDAAGDMKAYANKALNTGQAMLGRDAVKAERKTEPAPAAAPLQPVAQPVAPPLVTRPEPPSEPPLSRLIARNLPAMPEIGPETSKGVPVDLSTAVARRRREVLDGIDAADAAPALKEGTRLMTPSGC